MTRLPRVSGRAILRALQRRGFQLSHVRRSHHYLRRPERAGLVVVPVHANQDLPIGTLNSVLRQAGMTAEELIELLRE